ncbi:hypothetical protein WMY93_001569 [Mugilogobius chulae]|uniref:Uncharacterized protein n=1 Tax=Mugilogobius chulae TaxID=88201 RepID=A0AAW0PRC5_9GOBI
MAAATEKLALYLAPGPDRSVPPRTPRGRLRLRRATQAEVAVALAPFSCGLASLASAANVTLPSRWCRFGPGPAQAHGHSAPAPVRAHLPGETVFSRIVMSSMATALRWAAVRSGGRVVVVVPVSVLEAGRSGSGGQCSWVWGSAGVCSGLCGVLLAALGVLWRVWSVPQARQPGTRFTVTLRCKRPRAALPRKDIT